MLTLCSHQLQEFFSAHYCPDECKGFRLLTPTEQAKHVQQEIAGAWPVALAQPERWSTIRQWLPLDMEEDLRLALTDALCLNEDDDAVIAQVQDASDLSPSDVQAFRDFLADATRGDREHWEPCAVCAA